MKALNYRQAETLEGAVEAYTSAGAAARYIAGGTTLYDLMKLGIERPENLVDLTSIAGLDRIETSSGVIRIGAMALLADVAFDPVIQADYPVLSESLLKAASQQLRNMATISGNLLQRTRCPYFRAGDGVYPCNKRQPGSGCAAIGGLDRNQAILGISDACTAVAPGDWPVALVALNATVETFGPGGRRTLPVSDLYRLPGDEPEQEFSLLPGELITAVTIPKSDAAHASTYHKIRDRASFAFALSSAAVVVALDGQNVRDVQIALGGVATVPWRATPAEELLRGTPLTRESALAAGNAAFAEARPGKHNAFKVQLGARVVADALIIAAERSRT